MQQMGTSSTAASSALYSIAVTWREWSSQHHIAVKSCLQIPGPLHCRVTDTAQLVSTTCSRCAQAALQHHQHCVALLSHREISSPQHHTAVNSCLQIPMLSVVCTAVISCLFSAPACYVKHQDIHYRYHHISGRLDEVASTYLSYTCICQQRPLRH